MPPRRPRDIALLEDSDDDLVAPPAKLQKIADSTGSRKNSVASQLSSTPGPAEGFNPAPPKVNRGGASKLRWFNILATHPNLGPHRKNLFDKIKSTKSGVDGCIEVVGFDENTRPVMDKALLAQFKTYADDAPARYAPYHISLMQAGRLVPNVDPPKCPEHLRQVKNKRTSGAAEGNDNNATWVASHRCHNRLCINSLHLCWEPSWYNRLRDNCPGGELCPHVSDPCLRPHRAKTEDLDWRLCPDYQLGGG